MLSLNSISLDCRKCYIHLLRPTIVQLNEMFAQTVRFNGLPFCFNRKFVTHKFWQLKFVSLELLTSIWSKQKFLVIVEFLSTFHYIKLKHVRTL